MRPDHLLFFFFFYRRVFRNYRKKPTFRHHDDAIFKTNLQIMRGVKYIGLIVYSFSFSWTAFDVFSFSCVVLLLHWPRRSRSLNQLDLDRNQ